MDLHRTMWNLLIYGFLFILVIKEGLAISCYSCNSRGVESCENFKSVPPETKEKMIIDCDKLQAANVTAFTMCRIISQDIDGETRVIRQCASGGSPGECYTRTGTHRIKMTYCECTKDLCNKGDNLYTNKLDSLIVSFIIYLSLKLGLTW